MLFYGSFSMVLRENIQCVDARNHIPCKQKGIKKECSLKVIEVETLVSSKYHLCRIRIIRICFSIPQRTEMRITVVVVMVVMPLGQCETLLGPNIDRTQGKEMGIM
jgi:hypothetical protein